MTNESVKNLGIRNFFKERKKDYSVSVGEAAAVERARFKVLSSDHSPSPTKLSIPPVSVDIYHTCHGGIMHRFVHWLAGLNIRSLGMFIVRGSVLQYAYDAKKFGEKSLKIHQQNSFSCCNVPMIRYL